MPAYTGVPLEQILESFGGYFFETIKKSGHSKMLRTLGHNLHGFLMNLDSLHDHLSVTYPEMQAPSFRCEKSGRTLLLHYYSLREGLHPIVTGIVKAVAQHYFKLDVEIKMEKYERTQEQLCHYYVFRINVKGSKKEDLERMLVLYSFATCCFLPLFPNSLPRPGSGLGMSLLHFTYCIPLLPPSSFPLLSPVSSPFFPPSPSLSFTPSFHSLLTSSPFSRLLLPPLPLSMYRSNW